MWKLCMNIKQQKQQLTLPAPFPLLVPVSLKEGPQSSLQSPAFHWADTPAPLIFYSTSEAGVFSTLYLGCVWQSLEEPSMEIHSVS